MKMIVSKPNYDTTFAPMLEVDGERYYIRDPLGKDAPMAVFELIQAMSELIETLEAVGIVKE